MQLLLPQNRSTEDSVFAYGKTSMFEILRYTIEFPVDLCHGQSACEHHSEFTNQAMRIQKGGNIPIAPVLRVGPLSRGQPTPSEMHSNARNFSSLLYPSHIRPNSWGELSIFRTPPYNLTRFHNAQHCSLQHLLRTYGELNFSPSLSHDVGTSQIAEAYGTKGRRVP